MPFNYCEPECGLRNRSILIANCEGVSDTLTPGDSYYVTTSGGGNNLVSSVYFYDQDDETRRYFSDLGVFQQNFKIFEYTAGFNESLSNLVFESSDTFKVDFSKVNPLYNNVVGISGTTSEGEVINLEDAFATGTEVVTITSSFETNVTTTLSQQIVNAGEVVTVNSSVDNDLCGTQIVEVDETVTTIVNTTVNTEVTNFFTPGFFNFDTEEQEDGFTVVLTGDTNLQDRIGGGATDFVFDSIDLEGEGNLIDYSNEIERIRNISINTLNADKKILGKSLPVQRVDDNLIMLNIPFSSGYDTYFDSNKQELRMNVNDNMNTLIITTEGFLGVSAFKHNFVIFDPRPNVITAENERPLFPGYDPIYNKTSYEEILEHVYTTVYPSKKVPAFPNFRIGDFVINGEVYNPLFDYRNFRLFGKYDFGKNNNYDLFVSEPLTSLDSRFIIGRTINIGDKYYKISTDKHNSGAKNVSILGGVTQKVKPVNTMFERISKTTYDLNPNIQISV